MPENNFFNEEMSYDLNGNFKILERTAKGISGAEEIDKLTYDYLGTNRLKTVTDDSQNYLGYPDVSGTTISYDDNGNMKTHADKGILNIDYNFLNLPGKLTFNQSYIYRNISSGTSETRNVTTQYLYRADGVKLSKTYTFGVSKNQSERNTVTDYLDGFQYEGTGVSTSLITKVLKFVPTSEGYFNFENNTYIYNYTDHLGNVRVSYFKNANGSAEVLEESNYYPFGLKHYAYDSGNGNPSYKYQYNGKELQEETGWNDYGWRQYMPEIGRWNGMDQLSENYVSKSPYAYVANNPISNTDPDGRWINQDGSIGQGPTTWEMLGPKYQPAYYSYQTNFLGQNPGDGGGGGGNAGYTFTGNAAASVFNYFANGGNMNGLSFNNGYMLWSTLDDAENRMFYDEDGELTGITGGVTLHRVKVENKDFFTNLANNQYFSAGHLGVSEATSRFGGYALTRALNPDYINFTVLSDLARPYIGTTVAGIRMSSTTAANLSKYTRYGGYALAGVAVVATELQYADGQIGDTERWANHIMTGVGLIPSPWTIGAALIYGVVTGGYQAVTGRSIFNDMGLGPKNK